MYVPGIQPFEMRGKALGCPEGRPGQCVLPMTSSILQQQRTGQSTVHT